MEEAEVPLESVQEHIHHRAEHSGERWISWVALSTAILAALAAIAGLTDVLGDAQVRNLSTAWWHAGGNVLVVLIELYNFVSRYAEGPVAVLPTGLILSAVVVAILLFTGWKGWEMVYRDRVGVADEVG